MEISYVSNKHLYKYKKISCIVKDYTNQNNNITENHIKFNNLKNSIDKINSSINLKKNEIERKKIEISEFERDISILEINKNKIQIRSDILKKKIGSIRDNKKKSKSYFVKLNYVNYFFSENNYNDGILFSFFKEINDIVSKNNKFILNNKNYRYSNTDYFSDISHRLYCINVFSLCNKVDLINILGKQTYLPYKIIFDTTNNDSIPILDNKKIWFCKPQIKGMSKGIIITTLPKETMSFVNLKDTKYTIEEEIKTNFINKRKWDVRIYVVHTFSNNIFKSYLFYDGLVRLASLPYTSEFKNLCHITNTCMIKNKADISKYQKLFTNLDNYNLLKKKVKDVIINVSENIINIIPKKYDSKYLMETHIVGYDFIFDKEYNPYLIDINREPAACTANNPPEINNMKKELAESYFNNIIYPNFFDSNIKNNKLLEIFSQNITK
jgi:hypothetical protein